jgi:uncharacterized protein YjiS (DUF1127 family)
MNTSTVDNESLPRDTFAARTRVDFSDVGVRWAGNVPENEGPIGASNDTRAASNSVEDRDDLSSWPLGYGLYQHARAIRAAALGKAMARTYRTLCEMARRAIERHRQRRHARVTYDTLSRLDDHTLRDLGFDRLEISSLAAESSGSAESTRIRTLPIFEEQR